MISAAIPWLSYLAIGIALHRTRGHYRAGYPILLGFVLVALMVRFFFLRSAPQSPRFVKVFLGATVFLFSLRLWHDTDLLYAVPGASVSIIHLCMGGLLASASCLLLLAFLPKANFARRLFSVIAGLCLITAQFLVLKASPSPKMDVFTSTTAATQFLVAGKNPYTQKYTDIYNGAQRYAPSFPYWPGTLYWATPFGYLFGDIRLGFLLAELLSAFCIALIARRRGLDEWSQWGFSLAWLSFPVCLFIIEQSWIDTLLTLTIGLSCLCLMGRRWWASGLCLGILLASKQYAPLVLFGAAGWVLANHGRRAATIVTGMATTTFLVLMVPFLVVDARSFFNYTVRDLVLVLGFRADSLSLSAYLLKQWDVRLPGLVGFALTLGLFLAVSLCWFQRARKQITFTMGEVWLGLCSVYLVFFLFAHQAFCNYYYFAAFLLLLAILFESPMPFNAR